MIQTKNSRKIFEFYPGNPEKMGASATKDGYNFAVEVSDGKKQSFCCTGKVTRNRFLPCRFRKRSALA